MKKTISKYGVEPLFALLLAVGGSVLPASIAWSDDVMPTPGVDDGAGSSAPKSFAGLESQNAPLTGEQLEERLGQSLRGSELGGIFVDRTITMAGRTFYRTFSQLAIERPVFSDITLTVYERPDARWGSQVWINEGNRIYYRSILSPRLMEADETANEAVDAVGEQVVQQRLAEILYSDQDLAPKEF